jgi:hypothetical protein
MLIWLAVGTRALRASRSAHERREWARCARERITSALRGEAEAGGGLLTSMRWCRTSCIQARRCSLRLQSRQRSGADPPSSGCSSTLTQAPALPWLCHSIDPAREEGRGGNCECWQHTPCVGSRRRALRRSCAESDWPVGHRSVPSGWRGKSAPVKRPVFQEAAVVGGAYPEAGPHEAG